MIKNIDQRYQDGISFKSFLFLIALWAFSGIFLPYEFAYDDSLFSADISKIIVISYCVIFFVALILLLDIICATVYHIKVLVDDYRNDRVNDYSGYVLLMMILCGVMSSIFMKSFKYIFLV